MDNKDTKPKKTKKSGLEIRFTVSDSDGNLKEMLDRVPSGCYTDFTKTALRYYLKAVRDGEVECDFLKPNALDEFKVQLKQQEPRLEDIIKVIQACSNSRAEATPVTLTTTDNQKLDSNVDVSEVNYESEDEEEREYDIDINIEDNEDNDDTVEVGESTSLETTTFPF